MYEFLTVMEEVMDVGHLSFFESAATIGGKVKRQLVERNISLLYIASNASPIELRVLNDSLQGEMLFTFSAMFDQRTFQES